MSFEKGSRLFPHQIISFWQKKRSSRQLCAGIPVPRNKSLPIPSSALSPSIELAVKVSTLRNSQHPCFLSSHQQACLIYLLQHTTCLFQLREINTKSFFSFPNRPQFQCLVWLKVLPWSIILPTNEKSYSIKRNPPIRRDLLHWLLRACKSLQEWAPFPLPGIKASHSQILGVDFFFLPVPNFGNGSFSFPSCSQLYDLFSPFLFRNCQLTSGNKKRELEYRQIFSIWVSSAALPDFKPRGVMYNLGEVTFPLQPTNHWSFGRILVKQISFIPFDLER